MKDVSCFQNLQVTLIATYLNQFLQVCVPSQLHVQELQYSIQCMKEAYNLYAYPTMMRRSSFFLSISPLRIKLIRLSVDPLNNNNNNNNNNDDDDDDHNDNYNNKNQFRNTRDKKNK